MTNDVNNNIATKDTDMNAEQPLYAISQQYHILQQLGVQVWTDRHTLTAEQNAGFDRLLAYDTKSDKRGFVGQAVIDDGVVHQPLPISTNQHHDEQSSEQSSEQNTVSLSFNQKSLNNTSLNKKTDTKAVDNEPPQHDSTSHHSSPAALSIPLDERMGSYQPATPSPSVPSPSKPNTQQFPPTDTLALTSSIQLPMGSRAVVRTQRFELMGLSFRHFVLLADVAFMDTATKSVWQSLVQALGKQSAVLALAVKYPMFDNSYVQFKDFHHEQMALGGFLVRLCETAMTHGDLQCLILTPLSQGIELELPMTNAPNLMQMAMHKQAKMALWQILMGE